MKHLIETEDLSSLGKANYDRIILDSNTDDIIVRGGGNANGHSYVDLGLPSGLKWAKCNVGAETETEYGDYFMWGSTTPNTNTICDWEHAPFNGGASDYDSNYFNKVKDSACPNGVLAKEYDAATQIMGGDWRMPTQTEFQELLDNTTNERVTNYNGTGVNGRKFTSKTNGNSIFIPAAGIIDGGSLVEEVGDSGYVWSSSLETSGPYDASYLVFNLVCVMSYDNRCRGHSVRGVL